MSFAGSSSPSGWLLCDGSAVSRTAYAELFAAISTTYGTGDGSTTFNLPDMRGRAPVGLDNIGGTDAGRLSVANTLGGTGGEEKHTLVEAEIPVLVHNSTYHLAIKAQTGDNWQGGSSGDHGFWPASSDIANHGGGGAHNNMQPYLLMNWIIKT